MPQTATPIRPLLPEVARSYVRRRVLAGLLPGLAAAALLLALVYRWPGAGPLWLALAAASVAVVTWQLWPLRQWGEAAAAARLDRRYPALQDSTHLLLANEATLPLLPRLQRQRVAEALADLAAAGRPLLPVSFASALAWAAVLLAGAGLAWLLPHAPASPSAAVSVRLRADPTRPAGTPVGPARIEKLELLVTPPAYTRLPAFGPAGASFACPAGSRVRWLVRVSGLATAAPLLELGSLRLPLRAVPGQPLRYAAEQVVTASQLYRLRFAGQVTDDYALDVRPDQRPVLRIQSPRPYTLIAARGTRPAVQVQASARDDYGLARAELVLTVATGQGEAVKFREVRRDLSAALPGQPRQATLGSPVSLPQLGLHPGDELYLYLQATDNHGQAARSDTYLVQWQDSAAAASALDLGLGVNTAPAYFRSERQIIIDTEKLLAKQKHLSAADFANRANALGIDQQALRLRYGKFLGEEAEKSLGPGPPAADGPALPTADEPALPIAEEPATPAPAGHEEHDDDHHHANARPNDSPTAATDELLEAYVHKHDDAETADFLEPAVKAKLQAVLSEMWAAELRLRTARPAEARPYEYRALRLLKEVQQQTRAYVRKAGYVPPPLPEATLRLTGELKGAAAAHEQATVPAPAAQPAVRAALRWLAALRAGQPAQPADVRLLEPASAALAAQATRQPGRYLPALRALRELARLARAHQPAPAATLLAAEQGLAGLLPPPAPTTAPAPAPDRLSHRYFQELAE